MRAVGNLQNLKDAAGPNSSRSSHGLGHTRWATHGAVTEANAHPLAGCDAAKLSIVLNGIVENYRELRERLLEAGHTFTSETDAETVAHLIEDEYDGDLTEAVRRTVGDLEGHFTFVVIHHDHPDVLVGARNQTPMVVGIGEGEMFLASNAAAFLRETRARPVPGRPRHRHGHARGRDVLHAPTARRSSTSASSSTGTTRAPRRAATRRSC